MSRKDSISELSVLEMLEPRIAPASIELGGGSVTVNPPTHNGGDVPPVTWENFSGFAIVSPSELWCRDVDGDGIIVKFDRDVLASQTVTEAFAFEMGEFGTHLVSIDVTKLATNPKSLKGLDIDVSAISMTPLVFMSDEPVGPGDGLVNIDLINATGIDLGRVSVEGNLGQIIAGDSKLGSAGLESLTVESLGALSEAGMADIAALTSTITGSLKKLSVAHDVNGALLYLQGGKKADLVNAWVGGDLVGGDFKYSGGIFAEGTIRNIAISGDIAGGSAERSGFIHAGDGIKNLIVGGDIEGGSAYGAGRVEGIGGIGSIEVKGDVHAGTDQYAGSIYSTGSIKTIEVGGSLFGGEKRGSGSIFADKKIGSAVVHGDLAGGAGEGSGYLQAQKSISKLAVDGDLVGGAGLRSGSVATFDGKIGRIDHDGDAIAGAGISSGKVIDFANKGVKKTHSSGSSGSSGTLNLNGGTYSTGQIDAPSGASLILFIPGSTGSIYPPEGIFNYPTSGLTISNGTGASWGSVGGSLTVSTASFADTSSISTTGLVETGEGTLTLAGFDYVGDFQEVVVTSNIPLNTDAIVYTSKAGLGWPTDVVGAKLKRG